MKNPKEFVLKAQLGGGKGNYFGDELKSMLTQMNPKQRSAYTLMQKIYPISVKVG
jgi:flagellar hook-basal body complex protein FliE